MQFALPGKFKAPDGCLLLVYDEERALGAVAYKKLDAESCEMKSMFVDTSVHGNGVGAALAILRIRTEGLERLAEAFFARLPEIRSIVRVDISE